MRLFASLILALPTVALGQTTALPDIEGMTLDEIERLPEEVVSQLSIRPMMLKLFESGGLQIPEVGVDAMLALPLLELLYLTPLHEVKEVDRIAAVRAFQDDLGQDATGELTFGQWQTLNRRFLRRRDIPIHANGFGTVYIYEDYAGAEGTWMIEGDQIANPVNTSKIECDRAARTCTVIQADVSVPGLDDDDDSYWIGLTTVPYEVISWSEDEIIARGLGGLAGTRCRTTLLTLSAKSNEVYEITRNANEEGCQLGDVLSLPPLEAPQIARLVNGFDATREFWRKRREQTDEYVNRAAGDALEALVPGESNQ
jgi:hypothetical protein